MLRGEAGRMYLGFQLDPIYHVHWNDLAKPLSFEVSAAGGVSMSPSGVTAPEVAVEAGLIRESF